MDEMEEEENNKTKLDVERLSKLKNKELRILVESFYDMQKLRISMSNRVFAYTKAGLIEYINPETALSKLKEAEKELEKEIKEVVTKHPLWDAWFKDIKGIGPIMAAGVIAWRDDVAKADTVSAFWKFHGMAPSQTIRKRGEKLDYSPKAKTHVFKCGMQLLKAKSHYADIYYETKEKYAAREDIKQKHESGDAKGGMKSYKLHIHSMSLRKMIKRFLADTWIMWRTVEGLSVTKPYIFGEAAKAKGIAHEHFELPKTDKKIEKEKGKRISKLKKKYK